MLTLALARLALAPGTARRSLAVAERNIAAARSYWVFILTGFLEPLLYLLSIGFALGARIGDIPLGDGTSVRYATFVAPAMLTASVMAGSLAETTIAFYSKLKNMRLYESVVATPVRPYEIALGELGWTAVRGAVYAAGFLSITIAMGLTTPVNAVLALPAAVLVAVVFGSVGLLVTSFLRRFADLYIVNTLQFALFLFSGTFVPISSYPMVMQWVVQATPLYHSVAVMRGIMISQLTPGLLVSLLYLVGLAVVALGVAGRRIDALLRR